MCCGMHKQDHWSKNRTCVRIAREKREKADLLSFRLRGHRGDFIHENKCGELDRSKHGTERLEAMKHDAAGNRPIEGRSKCYQKFYCEATGYKSRAPCPPWSIQAARLRAKQGERERQASAFIGPHKPAFPLPWYDAPHVTKVCDSAVAIDAMQIVHRFRRTGELPKVPWYQLQECSVDKGARRTLNIIMKLLKESGDVEMNPGPRQCKRGKYKKLPQDDQSLDIKANILKNTGCRFDDLVEDITKTHPGVKFSYNLKDLYRSLKKKKTAEWAGAIVDYITRSGHVGTSSVGDFLLVKPLLSSPMVDNSDVWEEDADKKQSVSSEKKPRSESPLVMSDGESEVGVHAVPNVPVPDVAVVPVGQLPTAPPIELGPGAEVNVQSSSGEGPGDIPVPPPMYTPYVHPPWNGRKYTMLDVNRGLLDGMSLAEQVHYSKIFLKAPMDMERGAVDFVMDKNVDRSRDHVASQRSGMYNDTHTIPAKSSTRVVKGQKLPIWEKRIRDLAGALLPHQTFFNDSNMHVVLNGDDFRTASQRIHSYAPAWVGHVWGGTLKMLGFRQTSARRCLPSLPNVRITRPVDGSGVPIYTCPEAVTLFGCMPVASGIFGGFSSEKTKELLIQQKRHLHPVAGKQKDVFVIQHLEEEVNNKLLTPTRKDYLLAPDIFWPQNAERVLDLTKVIRGYALCRDGQEARLNKAIDPPSHDPGSWWWQRRWAKAKPGKKTLKSSGLRYFTQSKEDERTLVGRNSTRLDDDHTVEVEKFTLKVNHGGWLSILIRLFKPDFWTSFQTFHHVTSYTTVVVTHGAANDGVPSKIAWADRLNLDCSAVAAVVEASQVIAGAYAPAADLTKALD